MKVRYESDDGLVHGYGDEGKAAVEAHESDPLARFHFPWEYSGTSGGWLRAGGGYPSSEQFTKVALLGSRLAPLVQDLAKAANETWSPEWRTYKHGILGGLVAAIVDMENAMKETLNG